MNAQAELHAQGFAAIATAFLARQGLAAPGTSPATAGDARLGTASEPPSAAPARAPFAAQLWQRLWGDDLWRLTAQHLLLVAASVGAAVLIAVPLGVALFPHPRLRATALAAAGVLQTIPSLALLAVLIAWLGVIGRVPALIALTAYSVLPVLSNTCAGLLGVPPGLRNAAAALGMTRRQCMASIELPLALPTVLAGVRTASAIAIGTATIAAFIGAGGLGERIVTGLALNDSALMLAGALPAAALALVSELLFASLDRGLRRRRGGPARSG
jgi:osmoprotectant transport system permease protein